MTYQEILEAFTSKRAVNLQIDEFPVRAAMELDNMNWAMQSILEKLRDKDG